MRFSTFSILLSLVVVVSSLIGCGRQGGEDGGDTNAPPAHLVDALSHEERPAEDAAKDARRKPMEIFAFAELTPGATVLELQADKGYYTEVLSRAVGRRGKVYMHNPSTFDDYIGDAYKERLDKKRLRNVTLIKSNFDSLPLAENTVDLVTWVHGPHQLWFEPNGISFGDPATSFEEIFRVLKPGGRFLIIDHAAQRGSGPIVGGTLHRIDEVIIRGLTTEAGFKLRDTTDLLRNPDDDRAKPSFDPLIRGRTDQFVLLFEK